MQKEVLQFGAFFGSLLIGAYSLANINTTRYENKIVHKDPTPIDESKNEFIETTEPIETSKFRKSHSKMLNLQEEYARLNGLKDWDHKPVERSY